MSTNVFDASDIPASLWDPSHAHGRARLPIGKLRLPVRLEEAYKQALGELDLFAMAGNIDDREDGPIGEQGKAGAREHFAKRFSGSCGRIQLYALDPHHTFKTTRNALAALFSAGTVRLLDIPFGAGAGTVSLISAVAQLRAERQPVFPKLDLDVQVIGGDYNPHQIDIAKRIFEILSPWWLDQGINVTLRTMEWDVLSDESTSDLVGLWKDNSDNSIIPAVVCSNFSGFFAQTTAHDSSRRQIDEAESCLRQLFAAVADRKAMAYWIEPAGNDANKRVLPKLRKQVLGRFKRIVPADANDPKSEAFQADPIVAHGGFVTRATGIHILPAK